MPSCMERLEMSNINTFGHISVDTNCAGTNGMNLHDWVGSQELFLEFIAKPQGIFLQYLFLHLEVMANAFGISLE